MKSNDLQPFDCQGSRMKIAAAVIGGVSAIVGGTVSAIGSSNAADAQSSAANHAADLQQQQYQQTRQDQQPYMQAGQGALNQIGQDQTNHTGFATPFNFQADPGYGFQLQQGQNAINNSASATSGVLNGGTLKALDQYTTGLANTTYGDAYNRYLQTSNMKYNQLAGVASLGENAAALTGNQGANAANASGNYLTQAGNAQAAGDMGMANGINQGVSGLGSLAYAGIQNQQQKNQSASSYSSSSKPNNWGGV